MKLVEKKFITDDWGSISWKKFDKNAYKVFGATEVKTGEKVKFYELPCHLYLPKKKTAYIVEYGVK